MISDAGVLSRVSGTFKLSHARHNLSGATLKSGGKEYAVFAGGENSGSGSSVVNAFAEDYDGTKGKYTATLPSSPHRTTGAAVSLGDRVLYGGGRGSTNSWG